MTAAVTLRIRFYVLNIRLHRKHRNIYNKSKALWQVENNKIMNKRLNLTQKTSGSF